MTNTETKRLFNYILENSNGSNSSNSDYIDFDNGKSLSISDVEDIIKDYENIDDKIDSYIDDNNLDNLTDAEKIKNHFPEYEDFFRNGQAVLLDIYDYTLKVYSKYLK